MKWIALFSLLVGFSAHGAVLVEDNGQPVRTTFSYKTAANGMDLRNLRRVGVGFSAAGAQGVAGINVELNINSRISTELGFGFSTDFQAFHVALKRVLGGEVILPYIAAGYAYWSNNGEKKGGISETTPSFVATQFMSERDRREGRIAEHIIYPAFGLQYLITNGPWAGVGIFAEIDLLLEIEELEAAATGAIGGTFYF